MKKIILFILFYSYFLSMISAQLDDNKWVDMAELDTLFSIDMRYATKDNFVKKIIYPCGRCYLRKEPAYALEKAQEVLIKYGLKFKFFDCYRPRKAQQMLWDVFPNASYVTPPKKGSMHNRGLAVDLTLVQLDGTELDMGTEFDFFGKKAHHDYKKHGEKIEQNRRILKMVMEKAGFRSIRTEWWHYNYPIKLAEFPQLSNQFWECLN